MKIACVGYRSWALKIYDSLAKSTDHDFLIVRSKDQYKEKVIKEFFPDLVLFYGWSWIIPKNIVNSFNCVMLHPSALPKYRGGSPLQNQVIDGLEIGAVTLFLIQEELDAGPILKQKEISLLGTLNQIFNRITKVGIELTEDIIKNGMNPIAQDEEAASYCKRRTPSQSEITLTELKDKDSTYLNNKIRILQDPYPNAYIKTSDGKRLIITDAEIRD